MTSILPEMYSFGTSSVNDSCYSNSPIDLSTKSKRDKEGEIVMDVQEGHSNPRSLGYLHNLSDLIASSDIKPVDLSDTNVDSLWFGSGQTDIKASSSVLSGTKTAPTEEVSGCRNNPSHSALAETAERNESGTANHFLCPPIKVESDLVMENNLCDFIALEKVKVEADELVDVVHAGTSANTDTDSFIPDFNESIGDFLRTTKEKEISVVDGQSEEVCTRDKNNSLPDNARNSVRDSTSENGVSSGRKHANYKSNTNSNPISTATMERRKSSRITTERRKSSRITTERRKSSRITKERRKSSRITTERRKSSRITTERRKSSRITTERRKSSRITKQKKFSDGVDIDLHDCSLEDDSQKMTGNQKLNETSVVVVKIATGKIEKPRKAKVSSSAKGSSVVNKATEKDVEKVFCKDCKAAFACPSDLKIHELLCKTTSISTTAESTNFKTVCPVCHKSFSKLDAVKRHLFWVHCDLFHISCGLCHKNIGSSKDVVEHMQLEHQSAPTKTAGKNKKLYPCPLCEEGLETMNVLKEHLSRGHSNLLHISCVLCQRNVGSTLDVFNHFQAYHLKPSSGSICNDDICTATKPARNRNPISKEYICSKCNTCVDSYRSFALHLLCHKINDNTDTVTQDLSTAEITHTLTQQESASSNTDSNQLGDGAKSLEEFPVSLSSSQTKAIYVAVESTFTSLGQEVIRVLNRSLKAMTELSSSLNSELEWDSSSPLVLKDDLGKKLNSALRLSSAITDIGKCLILVLEENKHLKEYSAFSNDVCQDDFVEEVFDEKEDVGLKPESAKASVANDDESRINASCCTENQNESSVEGSVGSIGCPGNVDNATKTQEIPDDGDEGNMDVLAPSENTYKTFLRRKQIAKQKKKFGCITCGKLFERSNNLKAHQIVHSNERPFKCEICSSDFKSKGQLTKHSVLHGDDTKFKCDFCDFHHRLLKTLHEHMVEHKDEKFFPCDICKHQSRTSYDLAIHKKIHEPKSCRHCDYKTKDNNELKLHERRIHLKLSCPQSQCVYHCATNLQLKRHLKTHNNIDRKTYCCELCGKTFEEKKSLRYHMVRHKDKSPLSCPNCDYKCSSQSTMTGHLLKHAGLRPYICNICDAAFHRPNYLKSHARIHSDVKQFVCQFCGKGFKYKKNWSDHEMIHTGDKRFKCSLCDFGCQRNKTFVQHMEEHKANGSDVELSEYEEEI